ncbi:Pumilio homology domain family member 4 [Nakaseomyces bracarensis]|uniref:Pumilio homology domain family member 4 n=1 Tax=Nakaseomyces bracarensis TaxID=273131 RepID=A0ABR4NPM2_9SACH
MTDLDQTQTQTQTKETPVSDKVAAETVNSALEQLHLDDVETPNKVVMPPNGPPTMQNNAQSHMFPPPQMYGFMPYSQMMHMPHPSGFFHPPEFQDVNGNPNALSGGMPAMFNNSNDASMFPVMGSAFQPLGPTAHENEEGVNKDPFLPVQDQVWNISNDTTATNVIDSITKSSTITDENSEDVTAKLPGANTSAFRRQTFHAISTNGLVDPNLAGSAAPVQGDDNTETSGEKQKTRTQSISYDREGNVEGSVDGDQNKNGKEEKPLVANDKNGYPANYAAAYPYGGPPLQANPVVGVAGHQPPHSAYGVRSPFPGAFGEFGGPFQSFSPNIGGPAPMHPHSPIPMPHSPIQMGPLPDFMKGPISADGGKVDENVPILPQGFPVLQHQQGGTPPPWLYNNPAFNGMMPHSPVMAQGPPHPYGRNKDHMNDKNDKNHFNNRNRGRRNHHYYNNEDRQRKLEDASRYANASLDEFIGNIYSLCKDQHGCRFLQKQLDLLGEKASDAIFEETKQYTIELMTDSFGNYLIQKLLERVSNEQRIELATIAAPKMVEISKDPHGTRALQKLIECISTKEEATIVVDSLKANTVELSKDLNGNHVIQKCLQKLKPEDFQFIFDAAGEECGNIATHRHGCCVLQRCLDHGSKKQFKELCEKLLKHVDKLTIDPFGNYVVQYIISKEADRNDYDYTYKIVNLLKPRFTELSVHKFGSNVVEKILRTPVVAETMINELINEGEAEVQTLLNDSFGNYVLQTALDISRESNNYMYKKLVDLVSPLLVGPIRNTPHGKRIMGILHIE